MWVVRPGAGALVRDDRVLQPPKEEKVENKEQLGLTTLFPGQKRRISHLSKQGKEVRVCFGVRLVGGKGSPVCRTRLMGSFVRCGPALPVSWQRSAWGPHPV